jgi:hypothetical protein
MGKTIKKPAARCQAGGVKRASTGNLSSPKQKRQMAAVAEFFRRKQDAWRELSSAERRKQVAAWDRMKRGVNAERAGYREPFVD